MYTPRLVAHASLWNNIVFRKSTSQNPKKPVSIFGCTFKQTLKQTDGHTHKTTTVTLTHASRGLRSCPWWDSNHDTLLTRQSALPTELPGQLSRQSYKSTTLGKGKPQINLCNGDTERPHIICRSRPGSPPKTSNSK